MRCLHRHRRNRIQQTTRETSPLTEQTKQDPQHTLRQPSPVDVSTNPPLSPNAPLNRGGTNASRRDAESREDITTPEEGEKTPNETKRHETNPYLPSRQKPRSRPKIKCRFGPYHRQVEAPTSSRHCDDSPPQLQSNDEQIFPPILDADPPDKDVIDPLQQGEPHLSRSVTSDDHTHPGLPNLPHRFILQPTQASKAIWLRADEGAPSHLEDECALDPAFPARVTLCSRAGPSRTPFDKYKASAEEAPRPNPKRFVLRKLGLSEEEFDARTAKDV